MFSSSVLVLVLESMNETTFFLQWALQTWKGDFPNHPMNGYKHGTGEGLSSLSIARLPLWRDEPSIAPNWLAAKQLETAPTSIHHWDHSHLLCTEMATIKKKKNLQEIVITTANLISPLMVILKIIKWLYIYSCKFKCMQGDWSL